MPRGAGTKEKDDSEEEDFMSDAFLASILPSATSSKQSTQSTSYNDRRKQAQKASEARNKANAPKSFKQLREDEEERRKEGLKKSLFQKEQEAGKGPSKALKMMMNMGFSVGDSLGRQPSEKIIESGPDSPLIPTDSKETSNKAETITRGIDNAKEEEEPEFGGIGRSKRRKLENPAESSPSPGSIVVSTLKNRLEPLGIKLWAGRKGLGAQSKAPPSPSKPKASDTVSPVVPLDAYAYRSRQQIEYEERKAESQLRSARQTVIELDERANRGFSILHLDPSYLPSFPPPLIECLNAPSQSPDEGRSDCLGHDLDSAPEQAVPDPGFEPQSELSLIQAEKLKKQMEADSLGPLEGLDGVDDDRQDDIPFQPDKSSNLGRTENERSCENEKEDEEDWVILAGEARKWIVLTAPQRLSLTQDYLRSEFSYCIFCGFAYDSSEQMDRECPGLTEQDHD